MLSATVASSHKLDNDLSNPVILQLVCPCNSHHFEGLWRMKDVYEVLRQKEREVSRLKKEVEALRVAAPLVSEDGETENDNPPTLRAVNDTPQPDHSGWQDRAQKRWP